MDIHTQRSIFPDGRIAAGMLMLAIMTLIAEIAPDAAQLDTLSPPLKWAGGKRWLVPMLRPVFAQFKGARLVEPFAGGLAVALGLKPRRALLNDSNPHLINFYHSISEGLAIKIRCSNDEGRYYAVRDRFNRLIDSGRAGSALAASYFYYLNRTGYNGLCRFNSDGFYNVPFGKYSSIKYQQSFEEYAEQFKRWEFACCDFSELSLKPSDFLYIDPPYDVEFTKYSANDFRWGDQERLAEWLCRHKGPIVASNQATKRIVSLYRECGFSISYLDAPRMISCNGDREKAKEILAIKNI